MKKFFDWLGLILSIILQLELNYQSLCKQNLDWYNVLHDKFEQKWDSFLDKLQQLKTIQVSRPLLKMHDPECSYEIHRFAHLSIEAYGNTIYVRFVTNHSISATLFALKDPLAPKQTLTILRFELSIGLLLLAHIKKNC